MTKKQKTSKQNEKDQHPFRFQNLHERLNNININVVHRIRYHDTNDHQDTNDLIRTSYFHQSLQHWSTLNFSEAYSTVHEKLLPLARSLEQVVYNREQILSILRQTLNERNPLVVESLLDLIVQLARDLQGDFYAYYKQFLFIDIINLLINSKKQQQNEINTQLLEQVFQCLTYLFKYLWRIMLKDLASLYELYSKFLFSSSFINTLTTNYEYIRSFAAESFAYLLRKIENYQSFIDYLFDRKERDDNEIESLALVFSETCQNVQSTFHSCTKTLLTCLLRKCVDKPTIIQSCIKTIYSLLVQHTNKEHVGILWNCLMDIYRTLDHYQIKDYLIYEIFYGIFQILIDHKMIIDINLCYEFLTMINVNENDEFLKMHYETVFKLMQHTTNNKQIIDIYYHFVEQTSASLLYEQTRKIFQSDLNDKLTNDFHSLLWNHLVRKTNGQLEIMDYFVDYIIIERKRFDMILLPNDNNQNIFDKIKLLKTKNKLLMKEKITAKGLESIQMFIQDSLSKIDDAQVLLNGQLWQALILFNSLHEKDSNQIILTNTHLEKIIARIVNDCLSSTTIALILLELIAHDQSFPATFWYSILKLEAQSELYLLGARISFLINSPTEDHSEKFIELLKTNLSSFNSNIRLVSLYILSSFISDKTDKNNVILNCLQCEQCPLNVYEYRSKIIYLQKLSVDFLLLNNQTSSFHLSMYYLLGLLSSNFTPLWSVSIELLGSYGNKGIEHIGHTYFWSIINEKFQLINQREELKSIDQISDKLINAYIENNNKKEFEINEQSMDYIQYRINLFKILTYFPNECEQKTKILFPIIFDFFSNEYYDHLLSLGLFSHYKTSFRIKTIKFKRLSRKLSIKTLETILSLLKQFHHYKQWFEPLRLYNFYVRLLLSSDCSIQQLAFKCLLTCYQIPESIIQSDFLTHSESILPIFNPSTCRKTFHDLIQGVLLEQNISDSLKTQYAFILIRVIYSKLNDKRSLGSTTRGRKDYLELNRKYLFQFLITFASNNLYDKHFHYFIQLLLEPFYDELFNSDDKQWLNLFNNKILLSNDEFDLNSYEIFIKYVQHSLLLLKTFISKLGVYVREHIDYVIKFYILTIKFVDHLNNQKCSQEDNFQIKKNRILLKRIRSMSYKGLQTIFELFDSDQNKIFKKDLIDNLWLCCVRENYLDDVLKRKKQREDIVHLLKLATIWSSTTYLKNAMLNDRNDANDLMKCFSLFLNENITNENKQLIIEFIWNIMQIDPDDALIVPYNDNLLSYLTRVSKSMIESSSTISLTPKEFDILLILSRKESKSDKIEQLCSIFFRLLRQNVLSKKKKKFSNKTSEQDLNISILKVLQNLIINIQNPIEKYLNLLPILCCKIIQRDQRIELIKLFQILINQSENIEASTHWYLTQLIEVNAWNGDQVDEPDYERRLNGYKQITDEISLLKDVDKDKNEHLCLCLFYHCLYELHYSINDLSLREYASQCIHLFLKQLPSYQSYLLTEIRSILKQSHISIHIRHEFIRLLALIIDINSDNEDLNDLKRLHNYNDIELDFFHNITHVQNHRRLRALRRCKLIHDEQPFRLTTMANYLLPIVCSFINDVINGDAQDIHDDIVFVCLTALCQKLPWLKYNQLFISYFRQLQTTKHTLSLTQKRCLTKTVSAIIDAFHFQLNTDEKIPENERISRTIQQRLLPMILDLLSQNSFSIDSLTTNGISTKNATIDDQRQQAVLLTITCSLIATKLIVIFPNDFIEQHISTILLHLLTLLRSRLYSIRDQARDCLCKCITILGKRYFKFIIEELIGGLKRGYQHFVLLHTIHTILIHVSSLPNDFKIDPAAKVIANLFIEDLLNTEKTESSKASEHENSSYKPSNIPEAKTNKTANVMELLGRLIQSNDELLICMEPLRQQLSSNSDSRQISKCEKCLQRFQTGLINNKYLSIETLFIFVYHLLTKTDEINSTEQINSENKKKLNSITEELNKYHLIPAEPKRGHARVAQAIKHVKKTNLHCLIAWTLNLLHKLIKKHKNDDEKFLSMVDPFVGHIEICLNSQYTDVIVASLRNLSSLLEYSLPSLNQQRIINMYKKVFDLLKMYASVAGSTDMNDLLTLCYKILGTFVQRSINDDVSLTSEEYQCLFTYIESDLLNVHRQSSAFLLLRSIMRHSVQIISNDKNLRTQLDNLLRSRLIFMLVQSPYDHIRTTCRDLFHIYLFSYEHTKAKLKSYFDFFLLQLDYEDYNGRLSVLTFLNSLFNDLTKQRLNDYAAYFFLPLSCHYYNETNNECKKYFQLNLHLLLEKIDEQHRNDILKNIVLIWINDRIEHRCLALQLFILFIEIEHEQFDQHLSDIFDFIEKELNDMQNNNDDNGDDNEQQKFNDQYFYHLINVLVNVIKHCPNSLEILQLRSKWLNILKLIDEKCLLHPHIWVRFLSAQFFGLLFARNKPEDIVSRMNKYLTAEHDSSDSIATNENGSIRKRMKKSSQLNLDQEPLLVHYVTTFDSSVSPYVKIQRLCCCSCSQLKPSDLTEAFCLEITKNLIYLSKLLVLSDPNRLDLIVKRCCRLTTFESTKHPNEIARRSSVLKWMAALILDLSSSLTAYLTSFLTVIEREIERDETTINLPLKTLALDVFDVFKRHCDIHVITSIYADIAKQRRAKRLERKQKLAVLAINQPEIIYRKKRAKQTKRLGLGKKKRMKAIENAKKSRRKKQTNKTSEDMDEF
ncbi:unnamed protein product [Rotaria socialis]|uniref:Uncharacterized protein n=1 Tax=Rotaria socialis TaxID=392032 RepID=A0A820I9D1_9BILA|nr:unnamed protein product [Rotaria socialis]CAF4303715.1 unnamed protein product [Rotaria socialis]